MLMAAATTLNYGMSEKLSEPFILLQYADDSLIFCTARERAVQTLGFVLNVFSKVSGLSINFSKSNLLDINLPTEVLSQVELLLGCKKLDGQFNYLGLPLTCRKPDRSCFLPLIDKIRKRLASWRQVLLSRAGRLQLVKYVLSALPIYFMFAFRLPKWVIKEIDKLRRSFLWGKNNHSKGMHLINWQSDCLPKNLGGLGVSNIDLQNNIMLFKWWWKLFIDKDSLWSVYAYQLVARADRRGVASPLLWPDRGSFFWKSIRDLRSWFQASAYWQLGRGWSRLSGSTTGTGSRYAG